MNRMDVEHRAVLNAFEMQIVKEKELLRMQEADLRDFNKNFG
jgi:hypothetical protein